MFKEALIDYIRSDYRELNDLEVVMDGKPLTGSLYNLLTPYLAHTNTLDEYNRIISFYTEEGSKQQKLLPMYIALSNYYKTYNDLKAGFSTDAFNLGSLEEKLEILNNSLPTQFTFLGKRWRKIFLSFDSNRSNKIHFFIESLERKPRRIAPQINDMLPRLRSFISDYSNFELRLKDFQMEFDAFLEKNRGYIQFEKIAHGTETSIHDILKLGRAVNKEPKSGVLLFTNKTKYLQLVRDTSFNGKAVADTFPIAEIVISNGEIKVVQEKFKGVKPIIYLCSSENYAGWRFILNEIGSKYVNTLVLDDLDEILDKEKRSDFAYFRQFTEEIKIAQAENRLKDIYFLQKSFNFPFHQLFEELRLDIYPWLINHKERSILNGNKTAANHSVYSIQDTFGSEFWKRFKVMISHFRSIIFEERQLDIKVKYLGLLKEGYDLLSRATSFYSPALKIDLEEWVNKMGGEYFLNQEVSFRNKMSGIHELTSLQQESSKVDCIIKILRERRFHGRVVIVSKNNSEIDKKYLRNKIAWEAGVEVDFILLEDLNPKELLPFNTVFFLNFSGKLTRSIFLARYCKNQFLILNNGAETGFYKNTFWQQTPRISDISDFSNKLLLLNLENQEHLVEKTKIDFQLEDYLIFEEPVFEVDKTREDEAPKETEEESLSEEIEEQNFSFILEKLINNTDSNSRNFETLNQQNDTILLLFEDTFVKTASSKYFHILLEDGTDDIQDVKIRASEIKVGDKIFLLQDFNNDFNELLLYLIEEYPRIKEYYNKGNSWRTDLADKYIELGGYISRLRRYLAQKGINVTDPTVERWISGLTIVPERLEEIIILFQKQSGSKTSEFQASEVLRATKWLARFRTNLHKEIFLYHIYKKYNMEHQINNLALKKLISKMEGMVNVREVLMINKEENAYTATI